MKKLLMVVAAALLFTGARAQLNPMESIPADPAVRTGKLANGMTYYIRHNEKPKGQADFVILHNVGAIQEADNEQGLAHFLEHMAFNGTKNLPGKQMIEYLETVGVRFGYNLNAATTFDQTQYEIQDVPTTRQGIIDTALLILHDWSHFIALQPEEIDSERGVIMEELRTRDGAPMRAQQELVKALANGTKYEQRNVIGHLEGLKSFSYADIEGFYHTWYRPDYQAVVIVGDVDVDKVEADLKKLMSDIPAPAADAPQKELIVVPDNDEPIVSIFTDPEMPQTTASVFIKRPALPHEVNGMVVSEIQNILLQLTSQMMNARFEDIAMQPEAPFLGAGAMDGNIGIMPSMMTTIFTVTTEDGKFPAGFEAMLTEVEKARRYGFTEGEFERAQNKLMRMAESQYANRNDRRNRQYVTRLLENYKTGLSYPDAEYEWRLDSTLIQLLTVNDVNMAVQQLVQPKNWVVVIKAPEKEGIDNPTQAEVLAAIAAVRNAEIEAYQDNTVIEPLIADEATLKGSPVKKTVRNEALGTTEWTLKNGAKIIVKPTQFQADEVILSARSNGGTSILPDDEFYTAALMPEIMQVSGIGKFSASDLRKQLAGKSARVGLAINGYSHGVSGTASPKDLETMLQLVYLNFTAPRFNESDYNVYMKQARAQVENMLSNPNYLVQDKFMETIFGNNYRQQLLSPEILDDVQFAELQTVHDKLFEGANSFTFTFVGNVDMETLKPLVEKYIGSLPASKKKLDYMDDHVQPVKGYVVNDFRAPMLQPKVSVWYNFSGEMPYTIENRLKLEFLTQALSSRYLTSIREEKGGTYGVTVLGRTEYSPKETYRMIIQFDTNEAMADELMEAIQEELRTMAQEGPKTEDIEKAREYLAKKWSNSLEMNADWMKYLDLYYINGLDYPADYESVLKGITNADIQQLAQKVLADGNEVNVVMRPEAAAPTAAE